MERMYRETAGQFADRRAVLMSQLNPYGTGHYPDLLGVELLQFVRETERLVTIDPFEMDLIFTARTVIEQHLMVATLKLHEAIDGVFARPATVRCRG